MCHCNNMHFNFTLEYGWTMDIPISELLTQFQSFLPATSMVLLVITIPHQCHAHLRILALLNLLPHQGILVLQPGTT